MAAFSLTSRSLLSRPLLAARSASGLPTGQVTVRGCWLKTLPLSPVTISSSLPTSALLHPAVSSILQVLPFPNAGHSLDHSVSFSRWSRLVLASVTPSAYFPLRHHQRDLGTFPCSLVVQYSESYPFSRRRRKLALQPPAGVIGPSLLDQAHS